jgi:hypothetical protein
MIGGRGPSFCLSVAESGTERLVSKLTAENIQKLAVEILIEERKRSSTIDANQ